MTMPFMLEEFEHGCTMQDKATISDGEGGTITTYRDGAPFNCYPDLGTSATVQIAEALGNKSVYDINVPKSVQIGVGDIFKITRSTDGGACLPVGTYFRVTTDPKQTPNKSTLDLKMFKAEKVASPV